jgi:aconitate hydratase
MNAKFYEDLELKHKSIRSILIKPLTLSEKILYSHLSNTLKKELVRGSDYAEVTPDRVAMQDATAQMAILQFMLSGKKTTSVPTSVHCDHLIQAKTGAKEDLATANNENKEVYDFLETASKRFGMDFWKPGAGIIHQVFLEEYAFPGGLMLGTDSHSPNAGGLGMLAIGVGGADAMDAMSGFPWETKWPKIIGVKLSGKLSGWTSPKDVILHLAGKLTVKGGTGFIVEYFGEGTKTISATGKATICNMGAEIGATTSVFPFDNKMYDYLYKTGRVEIANSAKKYSSLLSADEEVYLTPESYYDNIIEINLSSLEPRINGPATPDKEWPISKMKDAVIENNFPENISACLIGSCTNSSYEDIDRCVSIVKQALKFGLKAKVPFIITPGSEKIRATIERNGQLRILEEFGGVVLANACGPCIGMWKRMDTKTGEKNTIVTSYNRNFSKRNDGNPDTLAFVASPEIVVALAISGKLSFNPLTDAITNSVGEKMKLNPPSGSELPLQFEKGTSGLIKGNPDESVEVKILPGSERIQKLEEFGGWRNSAEFRELPLLIKTKGKCTTDHISPAGPWLKFRGHIDNISKNLLIGAINAFTGSAGKVKNVFTGEYCEVHEAARDYQKKGIGWVVIGEENYGEGSSREHAAMEPRYLGGKAIIVKSFARIHEANLKKQGMLALTFADPSDYDNIREDDFLTIDGLDDFKEGKELYLLVDHGDSTTEKLQLCHNYNATQIEWFKAGSALNMIAQPQEKR